MKQTGGDGGFTLVELLVTVVLLALLVGSLGTLFQTVNTTLEQETVRARMVERLVLVADRIGSDLTNIARNRPGEPANPFRLVGVNGENTHRYVNDLRTPHRDLTTPPGDHSDRLHFHALNRDSRIDFGSGSSSSASERVYRAYWVNGPESPKPLPSLGDRWGLLKRTAQHRRSERSAGFMLPRISGQPTPLLDLVQPNTNFTGTRPVGLYIDYFSVRYYDSSSGEWVHRWDTQLREGELPSAVQFALRAYDPRNHQSTAPEGLVRPIWLETAVPLKPR